VTRVKQQLLRDHKNSSTVREIDVRKSGFTGQGLNCNIDGTKKTVRAINDIRAIRVRAGEVRLWQF
jgi:hypothetical protein